MTAHPIKKLILISSLAFTMTLSHGNTPIDPHSLKNTLIASIQKKITPSKENTAANTPLPQADIEKFATAIALIKHFYIHKTTDQTIFENAITGMLNQLDPHCTYLDKEALKDLNTSIDGQFVGIGVELSASDGLLNVIAPLDDTPAFKAGIQPGDVIIKINDELVRNMIVREAINKIKGKKGTTVKITILRKNEKEPLEINIKRDKIKIVSVKTKTLEPGYAYLRISSFQKNTVKNAKSTIKKLMANKSTPLKGMVLDLRNNPGGLLDASAGISDLFLDKEKTDKYKNLIVYTKGRTKESDLSLKTKSADTLNNLPLVVLINNGSASASEIVAGALQDYRRAVIMGTKTFGKGSVQTVIPIGTDSAIKLTTALYYTPAGNVIQAHGITPDVNVPALKIDEKDPSFLVLSESDFRGHIPNKDRKALLKLSQDHKEVIEKEFELAKKDYQLYSALLMLKGLQT